jgi:hypothetical protein
MGQGDLHQDGWDDMKVTIKLHDADAPAVDGNCLYTIEVYPSDEFYSEWDSHLPKIFASVVAATFIIMAIVFGIYDTFVRKRNQKVTKAANKTDKIVASLFPSNIRDRLLADEEDFEQQQTDRGARTRLKDFLDNDGPSAMDMEADDDFMYKTRPIADLFPEVTIMVRYMFAAHHCVYLCSDNFLNVVVYISLRIFVVSQHGVLPESHPKCSYYLRLCTEHLMSKYQWRRGACNMNVSSSFCADHTVCPFIYRISKRRRIFKVETVGDCYVAAAGLPEPRKDHAVAMARFAKECMNKMSSLTKKMEVSLGPDTGKSLTGVSVIPISQLDALLCIVYA